MDWFVTGINFKNANLEDRQQYALTDEEILYVYSELKNLDVENALILNTCNRTEFFLPIDFKDHFMGFIQKVIYRGSLNLDLFHEKAGKEAVDYFFRICSGLESQIPGDFEILGQVKKSCNLAKSKGMISGVWERIINSGLHAAKKARVQTSFFSGASSTSYACVEYLKQINFDFKTGKFLLIGTGKIGRHTIEHILKIVPSTQITVTNRSQEKADKLANSYHIKTIPFDQFNYQIDDFDVVICATNAPEYVVTEEMIIQHKKIVLIDLSVPLNIDPLVEKNEIKLLNVDKLSKIVNKNLDKRRSEADAVQQIINEEMHELDHWYTIRTGMPLLAELKDELHQLKSEVLSKIEDQNPQESNEFLDQYTDKLFDHLSQEWIKKVRNRPINE